LQSAIDEMNSRTLPIYPADLFSDAALRQPFDHYRSIRDLGAVVRLARPDVYAIARFADVQQALRSPEVLVSGKGVGFNEIVNAPSDRPRTIQSDGERHTRLRSVIAKPLMPSALKRERGMLKALISERVATLLDGRPFDAVPTLARHLPLQAVSFLVGLPEAGRARMLEWAAATFNTLGPLDHSGTISTVMAADLDTRKEVRTYLDDLDPAELRAGSWAAALFERVEAGRITLDEARAAIAAYVLPSLDTTIYSKASLLFNLASSKDQWKSLRQHPELIPAAVIEGVRHSAVVRWFSRVALSPYVVGDKTIPAGGRVMLLYGSANRDERRYVEPDRFDIMRNPSDQLGWGTGPHMCVGMHLARLEMEVLLEALVEQVADIDLVTVVHGVNRGLFGLDSLVLRLKRG